MPISTLVAGNSITASGLNNNFAVCVLTDTACTVSVTHTYTASQTFTGGFTTGAAATLGGSLLFTDATYDIGASGATRPRDFYLSRNAVIGGTVTVSGLITGTSAANSNTLAARWTNSTSGTAAGVSSEWVAGTATGRLLTLSQGFTPSAPYKASQTMLLSVNGELGLYAAAGNVVVYAGATSACVTITSAGTTFAGLVTGSAGVTVASGQTLTLTGATVAGTPTWSSSQAITLSTAAQPNITSLGTLTGLTMGGTLTMGANTLALASATVSGTPTWSSSQAITLSTAAQPNVTSLGTLTSLTVSGILTVSDIRAGGTTAVYIGTNSRVSLCGGLTDPNQTDGVIFIQNRGVAPSSNPTTGGFLYTESGALKYRGSSGTVTTIANA